MKEGKSFFLSGYGNDESGSFLALAFVSSCYVIHVGKKKKANGERMLWFSVSFLRFLPFWLYLSASCQLSRADSLCYSASMDSPVFDVFAPPFLRIVFVLNIHLPFYLLFFLVHRL